MNAFRGQLLASGANLFCSNSIMDRFANWAGQGPANPQPNQPANGSGNPPVNAGNPPPQQTNPGTNPQNNGGTNQDLIATIWDEQQAGAPGAGNPPQNPGGNPPQPPQPPATRTDEQMRGEITQHLQSVGLGDLALSAADVEKLQSGENTHQEFANIINNRMQQAYLQAVQSSQKLINNILEQRLPKLKEEAVNEAKAFYNGNELRGALTEKLPWTDDPALKPVAETVFRQFLVKGGTREQALENTQKYFERLRSAMDPDYVPPNPNTRTFRGAKPQINFIDVLKGN